MYGEMKRVALMMLLIWGALSQPIEEVKPRQKFGPDMATRATW
jgi:hypothetical protein